LLSAAAYSLGHGGNDAQKTMGIITAVLATGGMFGLRMGDRGRCPQFRFTWCLWLMRRSPWAHSPAVGASFTLWLKITKLRPVGGFCAETAGAITLFGATAAGIPVSTTHTITGAIAGVGSTTRLSAVKWRVAGRIVWVGF